MTIYYLTIFLPAGLGYVLTKKNDGSHLPDPILPAPRLCKLLPLRHRF